MEKIRKYEDDLIDFNKREICEGITSALDADDKKKNSAGICSRIFKMVISCILVLTLVQYAMYGSKGFKMPKYQNMQSASTKST